MADLVVPALGESITEAVIARWIKQVGEPVATDDPLVDLETDKITVELRAPSSGVVTEQRFAVGATVKVGQVIGQVKDGPASSKPAPAVAVAKPTPPAAAAKPAPAAAIAPEHADDVRLTPSQRRAMREHANGPTPTPARGRIEAPRPAGGDREEVVPMSPLRKRIAERLVEAQHTAAILTTFNEVDMSAVMALRKRFGEEFQKKHGIKLGFMSFFAKACVASLQAFPGLNAELRGDTIVYKKHYDLGIAVGGGKGLVVPVLRNADALDFANIELGIAALAQKATDNKLTLEDLTGGTFTITNGGIYGSMMSTPLLNMPQTGILGIHNIVRRPMAVGEDIQIRPMMYLALSYDHRVVDGREAVQFLIGIKDRIESPDRLLFNL